jgi:dTDP-4-amino-4,6-dideoxygalactose transaminase
MPSTFPLPLPTARYQAHREKLDAAVRSVFGSCRFILGEQTESFEKEFATFLGVAQCIGVGSGTDALEIALRACGIGPGDAVLTVSHTAVATVAAVERAGAVPVLVDIDAATFTLDPNSLEETIREYEQRPCGTARPRLKAVIPVHLYGHPADMPAILSICRARGLRVIEDCAQAHGASLSGKLVGSWGDLAAFSFYPTKNLGAFGDGGAVVTNNPRLAEKARALREYGWQKRHVSSMAGINSRLDELQAAMLRVLLPYLPAENLRQRQIAEHYQRSLCQMNLILPDTRPNVLHAFHQYVVQSKKRGALQQDLAAHGVSTQIHYPVPVHRQPAYRRRLFVGRSGLPNTETAARRVLSLPMSPHFADDEIERICDAIRDALVSTR